MAFSTIRDKIKTLLEGVTGIQNLGKVHDFVRHNTFWDEILQENRQDAILNDWEISREGVESDAASLQGDVGTDFVYDDVHEVIIIGRYALNDNAESEKTFQTTVDAVLTAFRQDRDLGATTVQTIHPVNAEISHESFHGILVHQVIITFTAVQRIT